ncbi:MAG: DUF1579 domain-containing protein [Tepidisphaeraceae bacterium]
MRTWKQIVVNAVVLGAVFAVGRAMSQDKPKDAPTTPDMAEMMKKWMATVEPGPNHKFLDQFVGNWKTTTKVWMDPAAPPMQTAGTAEVKWVLGGRFILQQFKGAMLMPGPDGNMRKIPHEGMGLTGYDNFRHIYVGNWADNMGTALLSFSGTHVPGSKTLTMYGHMDEPMMDMVARTVKYVTTVESANKLVFAIYDLAAGDNYKVIEVTYEKQ